MDLGKNNCKMGALLPSPLWISLPFIPTCQFCCIGVRHLLGFLLQRRVQQVPIWLDSNNLGRQAANTIFQNSGLSWREQEKHIFQREGSTFHIFTFTPSVSSWVRVRLFPHSSLHQPHTKGAVFQVPAAGPSWPVCAITMDLKISIQKLSQQSSTATPSKHVRRQRTCLAERHLSWFRCWRGAWVSCMWCKLCTNHHKILRLQY